MSTGSYTCEKCGTEQPEQLEPLPATHSAPVVTNVFTGGSYQSLGMSQAEKDLLNELGETIGDFKKRLEKVEDTVDKHDMKHTNGKPFKV